MKDVACELSRTFIHLLCLFRRPQSNLKIQQVSNGEMNYEIYLMEYYIVIKLFTESEATWKIHIMVHEKENTNIYTQYACHELHNNEKKKTTCKRIKGRKYTKISVVTAIFVAQTHHGFVII